MKRRRRIAWVWSISYTFASLFVAGAVWAYLSQFYAQAHLEGQPDRFSLQIGPEAFSSWRSPALPLRTIAHDVANLGGRALVFVLVLAVPGFEMNQQIWAALRARPRRVRGVRVYAWKLLLLNLSILLAAPILASLQYYLSRVGI